MSGLSKGSLPFLPPDLPFLAAAGFFHALLAITLRLNTAGEQQKTRPHIKSIKHVFKSILETAGDMIWQVKLVCTCFYVVTLP